MIDEMYFTQKIILAEKINQIISLTLSFSDIHFKSLNLKNHVSSYTHFVTLSLPLSLSHLSFSPHFLSLFTSLSLFLTSLFTYLSLISHFSLYLFISLSLSLLPLFISSYISYYLSLSLPPSFSLSFTSLSLFLSLPRAHFSLYLSLFGESSFHSNGTSNIPVSP